MVARSPTLSLCVAVYYTREASVRVRDLLPALKVKVRSRVTETSSSPYLYTAQFFESDGPIALRLHELSAHKGGNTQVLRPRQASKSSD